MQTNYLNEEKYQNTKRKISMVSIIVLAIGLTIGITLIFLGISNKNKLDSKYSEESKKEQIEKIEEDIYTEENKLKLAKKELEEDGIIYSSFADYEDGAAYELKIITDALNPSFNYCSFSEYKNNSITKKYCSLKIELDDIESTNYEFKKKHESFSYIPFFMFGAFAIITTFMISGFIFMITKRREMMAFSAQQVMPIAQEGMVKMAPAVGEVAKEMAPAMSEVGKTMVKEMAPAYKDVAKEITKGIKEGLKDEEN